MLKNYTCHGAADKRSRKELKVWHKLYELCLSYREFRFNYKRCIEYTKKDIAEIERMLKPLIKLLENKPLAQTDHPYYIVNK